MVAIKLIELRPVVGSMLGPVPPVPVAPLGDQHFLKSQFASVIADSVLLAIVELTSLQEPLPGLVVFLSADPHVEIRVDPGARENVVHRLRLESLQRLG